MNITAPNPANTPHLAYAEILINAPIDLIWQTLVDLDSYNDWNPFTYDLVLPRFEVDEKLSFSVRMSDNFEITVKERITVIQPPYALAWKYAQATYFLSATRHQTLTPIDEYTTTYTTWEQFSGLLAPVISLTVLGQVQRGFEDVANALKQHSETQYAE